MQVLHLFNWANTETRVKNSSAFRVLVVKAHSNQQLDMIASYLQVTYQRWTSN